MRRVELQSLFVDKESVLINTGSRSTDPVLKILNSANPKRPDLTGSGFATLLFRMGTKIEQYSNNMEDPVSLPDNKKVIHIYFCLLEGSVF